MAAAYGARMPAAATPSPLAPPVLRVTTPQQVSFSLRPSGLPTRAAAWFIDQCLMLLIKAAALFSIGATTGLGIGVVTLVVLLIDLGYFQIFEALRDGRTPGKTAMRLRVVSVTGGPAQPGDLLLRNLLRAIDGFPIFMLIGGAVAWLQPHHRRLGDLAAGTLVIRERGAGSRRFDSVADAALATDGTGASLDPAAARRIAGTVTREERDLLTELVLRRESLEPLARGAVFAEAATWLRARFALPESETLSDEQAVVAAAVAATREL